jgi:hypothetical protein
MSVAKGAWMQSMGLSANDSLTMTEAEVISIIRAHLEGLFPRTCPTCQRLFPTLRDYMSMTRHRGAPIPYDAEIGDWRPLKPIGTMTFSNCVCGTTLTLSSEGMPLRTLWSLLAWVKAETERRELSPSELLDHLRDEIRQQVLVTPGPVAS